MKILDFVGICPSSDLSTEHSVQLVVKQQQVIFRSSSRIRKSGDDFMRMPYYGRPCFS